MCSTRSTAPGGQCAALYPEKPIYDIPGYPRIDAAELVERLAEQAAPFAPVYHLGHAVTGLDAPADGFVVDNRGGRTRSPPAPVIIAAGAGAFGPEPAAARRHRGVRGQERLLPRAAARGFPRQARRDRRRRRFGGRLGAVAGRGRRAGHGRAPPRQVPRRAAIGGAAAAARRGRPDRAGRSPISCTRSKAQAASSSAVIVADLAGNTRRLDADCLLPFFGLATDLGPLAAMGPRARPQPHRASIPATCATSRAGIFAIGDIAAYPGKLKLILSGFAEAALAAHAIHPLVHPGEALHFEYSTTKGVPGR